MGPEAVDLIHPTLVCRRPIHNGVIGGQVDEHVPANRNQAGQRVETANEKLITAKNRGCC